MSAHLPRILQRVTAIRYVTPLREGGSLPALMETDDLGTYVVKFRGAEQGPKALVAEVNRWTTAGAAVTKAYDASDHALIGCAPWVDEADRELAARVTPELIRGAVAAVPPEWLLPEPGFDTERELREGYVTWLESRLEAKESWLPGLREAAAAAGGRR